MIFGQFHKIVTMEEDNRSKIVRFLAENGPSHPIQVGKVLGKDSFMTSAILSEVLGRGGVKRSQKNVGNTPIYYLEGQEERMMKVVEDSLNLIEGKVLKSFKERKVVADDDLSVQEKFVLNNLKDFVVPLHVKAGDREMTIWRLVGVSNDRVAELFNSRAVREPEREVAVPKGEAKESVFDEKKPVEEVRKDVGEFEAQVKRKIEETGGEILEREVVRKGSEMNLVVRFHQPFERRCFIKARGKKRITKSDLSMAHIEGADRKMPVVLLTYGNLSKKNAEYAKKKFGDMLRVVKL